MPWLQPHPDRLLDEVAAGGDGPDAAAVERETIELIFLVVLQLLPPRQRAAPIARDVLGWSAIDAHERCDAAAAVAIASQDIRVTMPPFPTVFAGLDSVATLIARAFVPERDGDWRLVATRANRLPAAASYLRRPGDTRFRPFKLDVLRIADGAIAEITTFGWKLYPAFGLEATLPAR